MTQPISDKQAWKVYIQNCVNNQQDFLDFQEWQQSKQSSNQAYSQELWNKVTELRSNQARG